MKSIYLAFTFLLFAWISGAQISSQLCPPDTAPSGAATCADACVQCGDIDGITTNNDNDLLAQVPDGFCAPQLHNVQWFGFVAGSSDITLEIVPSNCQDGAGLQMAVYSTQDCNSFVQVSNCIPGNVTPDNPGILNIEGVSPGTVLFLVVDGNGGDICDFTINVLDGSTGAGSITEDADIQPDVDNICTGGSQIFTVNQVANAGIYEWTLNGNFIGAGNSQTIDFPVDGTYEICVTPTSACFDGDQVCETVTVSPLPPEILDETICEGDSLTYQGNTFKSGGFYSFSYTDAVGCIQGVELTLNEIPSVKVDRVENVCPGEFVEVDGIPYGPGIHDITLTASTGCDSIINLNVIENPAPTELFDEVICEGEFVIYGGEMLDSTGLYQIDLTTSQGCDSTILVDLRVQLHDTLRAQAYLFAGDSLLWQGLVLDSAGLYAQEELDSFGCPYTRLLELFVVPPGTTILEEAICSGESFPLGDTTYTSSGIFVDTLPDAQGVADSLVLLDLTVFPVADTLLDVAICAGETFVVGSSAYSTAGNYVDSLTSAEGCDSIVQLALEVIPVDTTNLSLGFCPGDTVEVGGERFDSAGLYTVRLPAASGCDSLLVADIFEYPTYEQEVDSITCSGTSGTFTLDLLTENGCDSTLIVHLMAYETFDTIPLMTSGDTLFAPTGFDGAYEWYDCSTGLHVPGATLPYFVPPAGGGSYSASLVNLTEGCLLFTECSDLIVSTQEMSRPGQFRLYPNPATQVLWVENRGAPQDGQLELILFSADGRRKVQLEWNGSGTLRIPVGHLGSGIYWVQVRGQNGLFARKILIQKD